MDLKRSRYPFPVLTFTEKNAGTGGAVIAADYIEMSNNIKFVATTSNNNSINFWDSNNYIFRERLNTSEIQMTSTLYFV